MPKPIEVALDTNVLLDLANDDEVVIDCIQTIRKRIPTVVFLVLPTVIQELVDVSEIGETLLARTLALKALKNLRSRWRF